MAQHGLTQIQFTWQNQPDIVALSSRSYPASERKTGKFVRFQALMVASMKTAVFWDVAPRSFTKIDQCFTGAYCLDHQSDHSPDDGGSKHL
jgi:hypothetical protein